MAPSSPETCGIADQDGNDDSCGKCTACKSATRRRRKYRLKLMVGTLLPFLLGSLDLTIVATAAPIVARHFDHISQQTWIVTAYTLSSTALIPAFGQLADIFGRHATMQLILAFMTLGSVLCTAAPVWGMLILGRALQGVAAAGLASIVAIILADNVSLRENAKNNSIVQFFAGTAYCYGPVLGGYLTNSNWRWCFLISIPIAVFASITSFLLLRHELVKGTYSLWRAPLAGLASLDLFGTATFILAICLIILATTWGGAAYSWSSAAVLAPLLLGLLLLALFPIYERALAPGHAMHKRLPRQSPMIPTSLLTDRDTICLVIIQFATGAALYSIFYYLAIYYIIVRGDPPNKAGLQLLWYIAGIGSGVVSAGLQCNKWPAQTWWPILLGTWAETVGIGVTAWGVHNQYQGVLAGMTVVAGYGTGTRFMPVALHATGLWPEKRAQALSLLRFALPLGGTVALAIMGSVFNNRLAGGTGSFDAGSFSPFSAFSASSSTNTDVLAGVPFAQATVIRDRARDGVTLAFLSILPFLGISCLASLLLGNVWVKTKAPRAVSEGDEFEPVEKTVELATDDAMAALANAGVPPISPDTPAKQPLLVSGGSFVLRRSYVLALVRGGKYIEQNRTRWDASS